jgi:hypothetical protein
MYDRMCKKRRLLKLNEMFSRTVEACILLDVSINYSVSDVLETRQQVSRQYILYIFFVATRACKKIVQRSIYYSYYLYMYTTYK